MSKYIYLIICIFLSLLSFFFNLNYNLNGIHSYFLLNFSNYFRIFFLFLIPFSSMNEILLNPLFLIHFLLGGNDFLFLIPIFFFKKKIIYL